MKNSPFSVYLDIFGANKVFKTGISSVSTWEIGENLFAEFGLDSQPRYNRILGHMGNNV